MLAMNNRGVLLPCLALLLAKASAVAKDDKQRVVNGEDALEGLYPWVVALDATIKGSEGIYSCGGSLIHPEYVLTAAHCFYPARDESPWGTAYVGGYKTSFYGRSEGEERGIAALWIHPDYDDLTSQHDVAILKLDQPVYSIEPVDIRTTSFGLKTDFGGDVDAVVLGWGVTDVYAETMGKVLQQGAVTMISRYSCYKDYSYRFRNIVEGMVCAGNDAKLTDACQGDSGGPLFNPSTGLLVGVVSWGEGCGQQGFPGVYADVGHYHSWISGIVDWNYTTVTTTPTTLPPLWNGKICADKEATGWADNNGKALDCAELKEWGYCSPDAVNGAVINDCPVTCNVCKPGDISAADIIHVAYVWQGTVCVDKEPTGWVDNNGDDLSCTALDEWGYCNPEVQDGAVIDDCPITCGACIPEAHEPVMCAQEVQACADGSFVSRNPAYNCEFDTCPPSAGAENGPGGTGNGAGGKEETVEEDEDPSAGPGNGLGDEGKEQHRDPLEGDEHREPFPPGEDPVRPSMDGDPSRPGESTFPFCTVPGIQACLGEDVTLDGVSDECFAIASASAEIIVKIAACSDCTPSLTSPGTVCAACKAAIANAGKVCTFPDAAGVPLPPSTPAPAPPDSQSCRCKPKWSYGAKTYTGCAKTPSDEEPWCYVDEPCSGSAESRAFAGWHWAECDALEYQAAADAADVCTGLRKFKCKKAGKDTCRWVSGTGRGCYAAAEDLPCKAFPTEWKCNRGNGGSTCQWWRNKCLDSLICEEGTSKCCGRGKKHCWKAKKECTYVRQTTCIPRLD